MKRKETLNTSMKIRKNGEILDYHELSALEKQELSISYAKKITDLVLRQKGLEITNLKKKEC